MKQQNTGVRTAGIVAYAAAPVVAALLFWGLAPLWQKGIGLLWSCPFYRITGWYCPGCGLSRGLSQLLKGHFVTALRYNAIPFAAVILGGLAYAEGMTVLLGRHRRLFPRSGCFWIGFGTITALYCVLRNVIDWMPRA